MSSTSHLNHNSNILPSLMVSLKNTASLIETLLESHLPAPHHGFNENHHGFAETKRFALAAPTSSALQYQQHLTAAETLFVEISHAYSAQITQQGKKTIAETPWSECLNVAAGVYLRESGGSGRACQLLTTKLIKRGAKQTANSIVGTVYALAQRFWHLHVLISELNLVLTINAVADNIAAARPPSQAEFTALRHLHTTLVEALQPAVLWWQTSIKPCHDTVTIRLFGPDTSKFARVIPDPCDAGWQIGQIGDAVSLAARLSYTGLIVRNMGGKKPTCLFHGADKSSGLPESITFHAALSPRAWSHLRDLYRTVKTNLFRGTSFNASGIRGRMWLDLNEAAGTSELTLVIPASLNNRPLLNQAA